MKMREVAVNRENFIIDAREFAKEPRGLKSSYREITSSDALALLISNSSLLDRFSSLSPLLVEV